MPPPGPVSPSTQSFEHLLDLKGNWIPGAEAAVVTGATGTEGTTVSDLFESIAVCNFEAAYLTRTLHTPPA